MINDARAQLLFYSLNLLFGDVLVAFVVVVCLSSLMSRLVEKLTRWRSLTLVNGGLAFDSTQISPIQSSDEIQ